MSPRPAAAPFGALRRTIPRLAAVAVGLFLFVLALELLKRGAVPRGLAPSAR